MASRLEDAIVGSLLGSAVGDALGLPMEGLSKRRQFKFFPQIEGYRFFFGKGMISDDAEHACITAQALAVSGGDEGLFARALAWRLRFWFLTLPAGVGWATLRSITKLWIGFPPGRSGVFSAGNGPAMRSAIIGAAYAGDMDRIKALCRIVVRITHTDPKAEYGALAVALAASMAGRGGVDPKAYLTALKEILDPAGNELFDLVKRAVDSVGAGQTTEDYAAEMGLGAGVSGYIYHTVPVVLHTWFRHPNDLDAGLIEIVRLGGDTDTTASILGGIIGTAVGPAGIPERLIKDLWSWPLTSKWITNLGTALTGVVESGQDQPVPGFLPGARLLRNLFFLAIVLAHGFRRLAPPY